MAISQVGTATAGSSANGSSFTVAKPTGVTTGDVLVIHGASNKGAWDTLPTGFVQVAVTTDAQLTDSFRSYIWYKIVDGTEPANFTFASTTASGAGAPMVAQISAWRGCDTSGNPVLGVGIEQDDTYVTNPIGTSITTTDTGRVIYCCAIRKSGSSGTTTATFSTATSGWSELSDQYKYSGGSTVYAEAMYARTADDVAGTYTEPTVTLGGTGGTQSGATYFILALKTFIPQTSAPAGSVSATATAYDAASLTVTTAADFATANATAYNASVLTGVAATAGSAAASVTAFDAKGWIIFPAYAGVSAYDASVKVTTNADYATASVAASGAAPYFGAPESRRWRIPAEDRTWPVPAESREWLVEPESRAWYVPSEDN